MQISAVLRSHKPFTSKGRYVKIQVEMPGYQLKQLSGPATPHKLSASRPHIHLAGRRPS